VSNKGLHLVCNYSNFQIGGVNGYSNTGNTDIIAGSEGLDFRMYKGSAIGYLAFVFNLYSPIEFTRCRDFGIILLRLS
jgi:hypothetical protein